MSVSLSHSLFLFPPLTHLESQHKQLPRRERLPQQVAQEPAVWPPMCLRLLPPHSPIWAFLVQQAAYHPAPVAAAAAAAAASAGQVAPLSSKPSPTSAKSTLVAADNHLPALQDRNPHTPHTVTANHQFYDHQPSASSSFSSSSSMLVLQGSGSRKDVHLRLRLFLGEKGDEMRIGAPQNTRNR